LEFNDPENGPAICSRSDDPDAFIARSHSSSAIAHDVSWPGVLMTRHPKRWLVVASIFTFINLGGAVMAVASDELLHAAAHVGLMFLGAYFVRRLAPAARRQQLPDVQPADERLEHLQQSVDAIALEVERIGEAQRFIAKLAAERAETSPLEPQP
jgi:phosphatidylserine decarboxylase